MARRRSRNKAASLTMRYVILIAWALFCIAPIIWFLSIGLRPRTEIILPRPLYIPRYMKMAAILSSISG